MYGLKHAGKSFDTSTFIILYVKYEDDVHSQGNLRTLEVLWSISDVRSYHAAQELFHTLGFYRN